MRRVRSLSVRRAAALPDEMAAPGSGLLASDCTSAHREKKQRRDMPIRSPAVISAPCGKSAVQRLHSEIQSLVLTSVDAQACSIVDALGQHNATGASRWKAMLAAKTPERPEKKHVNK
jgi:hypothetical protein